MIYLFSLSKNSFLLWAYSQVIDWTRQNTNISNSKQKILWRHSAWNFTKSKGFDRKSLEDLSPRPRPCWRRWKSEKDIEANRSSMEQRKRTSVEQPSHQFQRPNWKKKTIDSVDKRKGQDCRKITTLSKWNFTRKLLKKMYWGWL